jgi:hypothetical protein
MQVRTVVIAAAVLAAVQGCASGVQGPGREIMGRVEGIYVEARPGVLQERALANSSVDGPVWASVALHVPDENGRSFMTARLDEDLVIRRGDLVAVKMDATQPSLSKGPSGQGVVAAVIDTGSRVAQPASPYRKASYVEDLK